MNVWKGVAMMIAIKCIGIIFGGFLLVVLGAAIIDAIQNRHSTSDNPKYSMVEKCDKDDLSFFQKEYKGVYTIEIWQNFYDEKKAKLRLCYKTQQPITDTIKVAELFEMVAKENEVASDEN